MENRIIELLKESYDKIQLAYLAQMTSTLRVFGRVLGGLNVKIEAVA